MITAANEFAAKSGKSNAEGRYNGSTHIAAAAARSLIMLTNNRKIGSGLESLEQRALMAADISFNDDTGVLTITGDEAANYAYVTFQGDEVQVDVYRLNGSRLILETDQDERIRDVRQIVFNALGGNDTLNVAERQLGAGVSLGNMSITYYAGNGLDKMDNNSTVRSWAYGGTGNDTLKGGSAYDRLVGQGDQDTIHGRGGSDEIFGDYVGNAIGGANDWLYGNAGDDYVYGGGGDDAIWGDYNTGGRDDGNDYLYGESGADGLDGDGGDDYMHGGDEDDALYGEGGVDTMFGGGGADHLQGGADTDYLYGDNELNYYLGGDDWLMGGDGMDYLYGGGGADFLQGGQRHTDDYGNVIKNAYDGWVDELYGQGGKDTFEEPRLRPGKKLWNFWQFDSTAYEPRDVMDKESGEDVVNWY
jgi:Ca2+-binding RTX toxin-like protein